MSALDILPEGGSRRSRARHGRGRELARKFALVPLFVVLLFGVGVAMAAWISGGTGSATAQSAGDELPATDNLYDVGSSALRWRNVYTGAGGVKVESTAGETGTARSWNLSVQTAAGASQGNLHVSEGSTEVASFSPSGALTLGRVASSGTVTQGRALFADGTTDNFASTVQSATLTGNRTITLPNETGTVCTTGSVCSGYAPASGSSSYIQNGTTAQSGNLAVQSANAANVAGVLKGAASQSAALLELQNSSGTVLSKFDTSGNLSVGTSTAPTGGVATFNGNVGVGDTSPSEGRLVVDTGGTSTIGQVVRGVNGQTANLLEVQDSTGNGLLTTAPTGSTVARGTLSAFGVQDRVEHNPVLVPLRRQQLRLHVQHAHRLDMGAFCSNGTLSSGGLGNAGGAAFAMPNDNDTGLFSPGANNLSVTTGGTERVRVDSNGLVGVNTTGADRRLDVLDATNPQLRLTYTDGSVYTDLQTTSAGYLYPSPSGGRVGIGTNSASGNLDVRQSANGNDVIYAKRNTDTSPTGNFLRLQNAASADLVTIDISGNLTVKAATVNGNITVNGHVITGNATGTTTVAAGAAACTSPTVSVTGNDTAGTVTVTTGTSCATTGRLATITFANAFGSAPNVVLTPVAVASAQLVYAVASPATTSFGIDVANAPTDSTTYKYTYWVAQ